MSDTEEKVVMCKCGRRGKAPHRCPYKDEIHCSEERCNCCDNCKQYCIDGI